MSTQVSNPEDRFSRDEAHFTVSNLQVSFMIKTGTTLKF